MKNNLDPVNSIISFKDIPRTTDDMAESNYGQQSQFIW
jgi:hypothetical protein